MRILDRLRDEEDDSTCRCSTAFADAVGRASGGAPSLLEVDTTDCSGGSLADDPACRARVIDSLSDRDADVMRVEDAGVNRFYDGRGAEFLTAVGRFVEAAAFHDAEVAARARLDPLTVAREAVGRAGPVARIAAESGLAECAAAVDGYDDVLRPSVAPTVALGRTDPDPPPDATLRGTTALDTGGSVAVYDRDGPLPRYQLRPAERDLSAAALAVLSTAYRLLADGTVGSGERAPARAVRLAAERAAEATEADALPVERMGAALRRHTRGSGVLDELFADPRVTDASLPSPATGEPLRVVADGEAMTTNVRLSARDVAALAARLRAESGRSFSRASPTADAAVGGVRVAAVTDPASDGVGFAFRRHADEPWTLPRLVAVGSIPPTVAGLLSTAVGRGAALLVAGPRGAGKTTLLGALCWELPPSTRSVVVEDTPELPLAALSGAGRDVQGLRVGTDADAALSPTEAVRTALRLGEGALLVGEVRGEEATALYEAMRVGAAADAVLGTIHGTGGTSVRERVVSDLGVPPSSFAATDLIVTLDPDRHLSAVEEVRGPDPADIAAVAERNGDAAAPTGLLDRGESAAVAALSRPDETYADVREAVRERAATIEGLASAGRTGVEAVADGYS